MPLDDGVAPQDAVSVEWIFDDVSDGPGQVPADHSPLLWSSAKTVQRTVDEFERVAPGDEARPVRVRVRATGAENDRVLHFPSAKAATAGIQELIAWREALPPGYGVARIESIDLASHELIYEHEYVPKVLRHFNVRENEECPGLLRPPLTTRKLPFRFWGFRVPLTADHARSWLGHALLAEVQRGRLRRLELVVQTPEELQRPTAGSGLNPHGQLRPWLWHVWPPGPGVDDPRPPAGVEVFMSFSQVDGILIELLCEDEHRRDYVYRVLKQYCDDVVEGTDWRPVPDPPHQISNIKSRESHYDHWMGKVVGKHAAESGTGSGTQLLQRALAQSSACEKRLLQALSRIEATRECTDLPDLCLYCSEVCDAMAGLVEAGVRVRPEWREPSGRAVEVFLRRTLEAGDGEMIRKAVALADESIAVGLPAPHGLDDARRWLEGGPRAAVPALG